MSTDWLCSNLQQNPLGLAVWNQQFDWEYRDTLKAPWYSALAQGQGISMLLRAHKESRELRYLDAAKLALACFYYPIQEGGVAFTDESGDLWFEEYIVSPPLAHPERIHLGCMGHLRLFPRDRTSFCTGTFCARRTHSAAQPGTLRSAILVALRAVRYTPAHVASPFYHQLHIVQLRVMHRLTREDTFARVADRWESYARSRSNRARALCYKIAFKLRYY